MELDGLFMTCLCWWGFVSQSCSSGTGRVCSFILSPGLVCWVHPLSPQVDSQLISSQPVGWNQKLALLILGLAFNGEGPVSYPCWLQSKAGSTPGVSMETHAKFLDAQTDKPAEERRR